MLKFLFRGKSNGIVETQRQRVERLQAELNAEITMMPVKPKMTFDPNTGNVTLELPEQMADEALALPAPDAEEAKAA